MIAIVDYGLGNVMAFANVYKRLNVRVCTARSADDLKLASKIILPGVGAFDHAIDQLSRSGMRDALETIVMRDRIPILGVCVGMQIIARTSEEGHLPGLAWIDGEIRKLDPLKLQHRTHLPHMGWNDVRPLIGSGLFDQLDHDSSFYFLHSYYFHCNNTENVLAVTDYGGEFSSAVKSGNIYGVQFHPEKSHHCGVQLLKNFAAL